MVYQDDGVTVCEHGYRVMPTLLADEVVHLMLYLRRLLTREIHGDRDIILGEESPKRVLESTSP